MKISCPGYPALSEITSLSIIHLYSCSISDRGYSHNKMARCATPGQDKRVKNIEISEPLELSPRARYRAMVPFRVFGIPCPGFIV